ncbi:MAG: D-alanine--D-alanine ligase [Candidatus Paceibacterota bacterium]|jgi:D-alanine-D-alanine ligase
MKKMRLKIVVLAGGPSFEHEISLSTAKGVIKNLNPQKYQARLIVIDKKGKWPIDPRKIKKQFDLCFIAMHGEYGEDGTIQGLLEAYQIPYTCSGVLASALGMDKWQTRKLFIFEGFNVPETYLINHKTCLKKINKITKKLKLPIVIKPRHVGSSVGISIVKTKKSISQAFQKAFEYDHEILIQKYIKGREVTCGVLDRGILETSFPLVPTEIIPQKDSFFNYRAKYTPGATLEITPPKLPQKIIKEIQRQALLAHQVIGCSGMSRTDFIFDNKKLWILEINTIPGLTPTSLVPQETQALKITYSQMLDIIIEAAFKRF